MIGSHRGGGGGLGAQFRYLGTKPLELGPFVWAQRSIICHSAAVLHGVTMAPSPMEMDTVITHNG